MRTFLQKPREIAVMLTIMFVGVFQQGVFGQTCEILNCPQDVINLSTDDLTETVAGSCIFQYTLPALAEDQDCDATFAPYRVELAEILLSQYNGVISSPYDPVAYGASSGTPITVSSGAFIPLGEPGRYTLVYQMYATSSTGVDSLVASCVSDVVMKDVYTLACNDQVQVTMDANCTATITPEMILEGESNACYFEDYLMTLIGTSQADQPHLVIDEPGFYDVSIISPTGEQCWGSILVEDKINAIIDCQDHTVRCSQTYNPGDAILSRACVGDDLDNADQIGTVDYGTGTAPTATAIDDPGILCVEFDFSSLDDENTVVDLALDLHVLTQQVKDVRVHLASPAGDTITVLDLVTGNSCTQPNFDFELSDDAFLTHDQLIALGCDLGNSHGYCGTYQPLTPLSSFSGTPVNGVWKLIIENYSTTSTLSINTDDAPELCAVYSDGRISFPMGVDGSFQNLGDNCYQINVTNNNCGPYTACFEDSVQDCTQDLMGNSVSVVTRTWTVDSASSGSTSSCTQTITIDRWDTDELVFPPSYDGTEHAPFLCSQFFTTGADGLPQLDLTMLTSDSIPAPSITGYPTSPFGDIDLCFGYQATFTDTKLEICGNFSFKVLRQWTIIDWCVGGAPTEYTQIIKVIDIEPPVLVCPEDGYEISTSGAECAGDWEVQPPVFVFDCGFALNPSLYTFDIGYLLADENGEPPVDGEYITTNVRDFDGDGNPDMILDLPQGRTWLKYTVFDDCGNEGNCFTEIDVVDNTRPTPVCVEFLVLALGDEGCAWAGAESFDKGSWDNCGIDSFAVRRLPSGQFDDSVHYCCEDFGVDHEVELKVIDVDGNENTCIVNVQLQNPLGFTVDGPDPVVELDCRENPEDLPTGASYESQFTVTDNLDDNICPSTVICEDPKELSPIDECGNGRYEIVCTITTGLGEVTTRTIQFVYSNQSGQDLESSINWSPLNEYTDNILDSCPDELTLDPENSDIGKPIINDYDCALIAMTYEDQVFEEVENACLKILRTWTVIDWCKYDPNDPSTGGIASYVQVMKINDIELPEFNCPATTQTLFGSGNGCDLNTSGIDTSGILVLSEEEGFDACSDLSGKEVEVMYEIDYHNDGIIENTGTGRNANGIHQFGCHTITWTITDHCENVNSCTYQFCIEDDKAPTPYCLGSAVTATMEEGGTEVWANDFDLGSTDNITGVCNDIPLIFTLVNPATGESGSVLTFDCGDINGGISDTIPLQMWVADEFGNSDYCEVVLIFQDNDSDACTDGASRPLVSGYVRTEADNMVENAMVSIASDSYNGEMMTDQGGDFGFEVFENSSYFLTSEKDDNVLNGVSTLDLVLIQKHILGIDYLSSPYKVIAADADRSGAVSAIDLVTIRKIILGIDDEFPQDDHSWRFVDAAQTWADNLQPFPYNEQIALNNVNQDMLDQDFIAVKIGDVNTNAIVNSLQSSSDTRSSDRLTLQVEELSLEAGDIVDVPVLAKNFNNIAGYQFTMWVNPEIAEVITIEEEALPMSEDNFGYTNLNKGYIATSWNSSNGTTLSEEQAIFTVSIKVNEACKLSQVLNINNAVATAEAYDADLGTMDVNLTFEGAEIASGFELFQNTPNPFTDYTAISFELPEETSLTLKIYDVTGKILKQVSGTYSAGVNTIELNETDLQAQGILYYQIESDKFTATKKMISLE